MPKLYSNVIAIIIISTGQVKVLLLLKIWTFKKNKWFAYISSMYTFKISINIAIIIKKVKKNSCLIDRISDSIKGEIKECFDG